MTFQPNRTLKQSQTGAEKLRSFLKDPEKIIICPGVFDGITARLALKTGFDALYMTGAGTSASRLGMADLGLANLHEMRTNAEMIANIDPSVPLIADADTGYGGSLMVGRTTAEYIRAGVAGFHIEDQVLNKRCGHLAGKELVSEEIYLSRIKAAVNMRAKLNSDIVIIARTDAIQSLGLDVAIERMKKAVKIGADVVFIEALREEADVKRVCDMFGEMKVPLLYNLVQGGLSPSFSIKKAKELGIKIVIYPGLSLVPVFESVGQAMKRLKETGEVPATKTAFEPKEIFRICGLDELMEFDKAALYEE